MCRLRHINDPVLPSLKMEGIRLLLFGAFAKLWKATISFVMSVCPSTWNNSAPTGRIFIKFDMWRVFENPLRKFKFHYNRTRIKFTSHEDHYTFSKISRSSHLRMKNISDKSCRETRKTHFMFNNLFCFLENPAVYEMWKNVVKLGRPQMIIYARCMLDT
jgi:hypothetical protein